MLLENRFLSIDPAIRQWIGGKGRYIPAIAPGSVVRSVVLGQVVESQLEGFAPGDWVRGLGGWERYSLLDALCFPSRIQPAAGIALQEYLGALGGPGLAAYFGLFHVGHIQPAETVLISSAAGAVGIVAGQIARAHGCRVYGIVGTHEKADWVCEHAGYERAFVYTESNFRQSLPRGVDVYFDNVGGDVLEAALSRLARGGRVVLCGATSQYDSAATPRGPANYLYLLEMGARMEGFTAAQFQSDFAQAEEYLAANVSQGVITLPNARREGLAKAPRALLELLQGDIKGKLLIQL